MENFDHRSILVDSGTTVHWELGPLRTWATCYINIHINIVLIYTLDVGKFSDLVDFAPRVRTSYTNTLPEEPLFSFHHSYPSCHQAKANLPQDFQPTRKKLSPSTSHAILMLSSTLRGCWKDNPINVLEVGIHVSQESHHSNIYLNNPSSQLSNWRRWRGRWQHSTWQWADLRPIEISFRSKTKRTGTATLQCSSGPLDV